MNARKALLWRRAAVPLLLQFGLLTAVFGVIAWSCFYWQMTINPY